VPDHEDEKLDEPETEAQDEVEADAPAEHGEKASAGHKPRGLKGAWGWLKAKKLRMAVAIAAGLVVLGGAAMAATDLKYTVLGTVLTTSVDVTVTDSSTKQPVPKALVDFGGAADLTDKAGHVTLKKVKLGRGEMDVRKTGYSDASVKVLGPLSKGKASVALKPNGIKFVAVVTDFITGGNVAGVEVKSGEASAISDENGRAVISLPPATNNTTQKLSLTKDGFNTLEVGAAVKNGGPDLAVKLTPEGKVYFQSNRTGRIDIYGANLDGTATELVLAGTGQENESAGILPSISDPHTLALVSTRDGRRNGQLHSDLFVFNTESRKLTKIDQDVDFGNFRAWIGSTLVYTPSHYVDYYGSCNSIKTYDNSSGKTATMIAGDQNGAGCPTIYQALSDGFIYSIRGGESGKAGIYAAKLTGTPKKISSTYSDGTVRRAKQTLLTEYYTNGGPVWDSIDLGSFSVSRLPSGPSIEANRYYNDAPDGSKSAFIEERDGQSELYVTDANGGNEKKLTSIGSANQFVQWYGNDYIVFSSTKTGENALYVIGAGGGTPHKVADFYRGNSRTYGGGGNPYN
jgi:hypothetical protein